MKTSRRTWWIAGVLILIIGGWWWRAAHQTTAAVTYQTATVAKGTLITSVSGTGNVAVSSSAKVNPQVSGVVASVAVKNGDQVKKGQTLFTITNPQLDTTAGKAYSTWLQAKQALLTAQATATNTAQDSGQAKAQVAVDQAQMALLTDQQALQKAQDGTHTDADVQIAQQKVTTDQDNLNAANIALAQAQNSAPGAVANARDGVAIAQKGVDNAWADYQYQLQQAGYRTVTSPIDGTVTAINVASGDQVSGGASSSAAASTTSASATSSSSSGAVVIQDLSSYRAQVAINEVDATKVKAGQKVSMTFDAVSGLTLTGSVDTVDTVGTTTSGVVSYNVTIAFDALDARLRPGMSLNAVITTDVKTDVITVPSTAVKSDTQGSYVQLMQSGSPVQQTVVTGATNDSDTEITSGLNAGDVVVVRTITPTTAKTTATTSTPSLFGGGGGGGTRVSGARIGN